MYMCMCVYIYICTRLNDLKEIAQFSGFANNWNADFVRHKQKVNASYYGLHSGLSSGLNSQSFKGQNNPINQ